MIERLLAIAALILAPLAGGAFCFFVSSRSLFGVGWLFDGRGVVGGFGNWDGFRDDF